MAKRKGFVRIPRIPVSQVLPLWTLANPSLSNALFLLCLQGLGINSIGSYLRKFVIPNALCALVCAYLGAGQAGILGAVVGALLGLALPAALLWCAITVLRIAVYLAVFYGAWVALFYLARWIFNCAF